MNFRIKDNVLLQPVGEDMVLLEPDSGVYFTLDAVGARMLSLFRDSGDVQAVTEAIVEEYEVEADRATSDLIKLLKDMTGYGLVEQLAD